MANDKNLNKKEKKEKKRFFKDFKAELKRVTWPTGKQLVNNTIAVITIVLITAAIVFVLDLCFEMLNKYGINKLKSTLNNDTNTVVENDTATLDTTTEDDTSEDQDNGETTEVTPDTNTVVEDDTVTPDTTTEGDVTEGQDNGETTETTSPVAEQ